MRKQNKVNMLQQSLDDPLLEVKIKGYIPGAVLRNLRPDSPEDEHWSNEASLRKLVKRTVFAMILTGQGEVTGIARSGVASRSLVCSSTCHSSIISCRGDVSATVPVRYEQGSCTVSLRGKQCSSARRCVVGGGKEYFPARRWLSSHQHRTCHCMVGTLRGALPPALARVLRALSLASVPHMRAALYWTWRVSWPCNRILIE